MDATEALRRNGQRVVKFARQVLHADPRRNGDDRVVLEKAFQFGHRAVGAGVVVQRHRLGVGQRRALLLAEHLGVFRPAVDEVDLLVCAVRGQEVVGVEVHAEIAMVDLRNAHAHQGAQQPAGRGQPVEAPDQEQKDKHDRRLPPPRPHRREDLAILARLIGEYQAYVPGKVAIGKFSESIGHGGSGGERLGVDCRCYRAVDIAPNWATVPSSPLPLHALTVENRSMHSTFMNRRAQIQVQHIVVYWMDSAGCSSLASHCR